jgi:hypothetical protein
MVYVQTDNKKEILLNTHWRRKRYLRNACTQLLAGCVLININYVLLIHCMEVYGREPSVDAHHERFGNNNLESLILPTKVFRY